MKRVLLPSFLLLIFTLVLTAVPTEAEGKIYEDTIRLHILANSDSEEDQKLKLWVRDRLLVEYAEQLNGSLDIDEAKEKAKALLPKIERDVNGWLAEYGSPYTAEATLSVEWYDTREYEEFTLPKGYYTSLRILIGEGEGKNWWCVMYPALCLDIAKENAPEDDGIIDYTKEEIKLVSGKGYNIKFKILEIVSDVFSSINRG